MLVQITVYKDGVLFKQAIQENEIKYVTLCKEYVAPVLMSSYSCT